MKININWKPKVNDTALRSLAEHCLRHVRALYPTTLEGIVDKYYWPQIETLADARQVDVWTAAAELYSNARTYNEKVFYLASVLLKESN